MIFFILGEFPELSENFRISNYPRMRTLYEYIMRRVARDFIKNFMHGIFPSYPRMCTSYEYIMRAIGRRKVADNKLKILSKYALNAAIVEKSPCI